IWSAHLAWQGTDEWISWTANVCEMHDPSHWRGCVSQDRETVSGLAAVKIGWCRRRGLLPVFMARRTLLVRRSIDWHHMRYDCSRHQHSEQENRYRLAHHVHSFLEMREAAIGLHHEPVIFTRSSSGRRSRISAGKRSCT